jgi:hypothetical protein
MSDAQVTWSDQVKESVGKRAFSLNYEDGVQTRVLPLVSAEGRHSWELKLEMTHSGHEFDLTWRVGWSEIEAEGIWFELEAPPTEGAMLWREQFTSISRFKAASDVISVFIRGYFVGRESVSRQPAQGQANS